MPSMRRASSPHGRRSASSSRPTVAAHSSSGGPGTIGPSQRTVSSVNIVTSSAIEFVQSSADCRWRQTRPGAGRMRIDEVDLDRRRRRPARRRWPRCARGTPCRSGPAPMMASRATRGDGRRPSGRVDVMPAARRPQHGQLHRCGGWRSRAARRRGGRRRWWLATCRKGVSPRSWMAAATWRVTTAARPRPRASGWVHTALDLGVARQAHPLAGHGDEPVAVEHADVAAEVDRAGRERPRLGELDEREHLRQVVVGERPDLDGRSGPAPARRRPPSGGPARRRRAPALRAARARRRGTGRPRGPGRPASARSAQARSSNVSTAWNSETSRPVATGHAVGFGERALRGGRGRARPRCRADGCSPARLGAPTSPVRAGALTATSPCAATRRGDAGRASPRWSRSVGALVVGPEHAPLLQDRARPCRRTRRGRGA